MVGPLESGYRFVERVPLAFRWGKRESFWIATTLELVVRELSKCIWRVGSE